MDNNGLKAAVAKLLNAFELGQKPRNYGILWYRVYGIGLNTSSYEKLMNQYACRTDHD